MLRRRTSSANYTVAPPMRGSSASRPTREITDALESLGFAALEEIERDHSIVTDGTTTSRVRADCRADKDVFRAISKIAMNYLDAVHPAVSRLPQFHEMASYVLSGRDPSHRPVRAGFERIIGNEP
ncbi:MAG: hypothetical protein SangKO_044360 [Sandaracinaceae bacterium]